ncbi:putative aldehyde dehydrogenase [Microdochium trichocladiopsis]|uniref:Aldehyde dehydrogenase n=1 Tax=Microdochium trichocladiopsis TaxID=1682393 RepID=A0A9P9BVC5_9PEZI|nr:putative aldehyde dehydrogenase [Microdochium trichocladiopsis]KAH7039582.1 putative aldehyde dehydrogenase [Microdochium trichocladiopsis]
MGSAENPDASLLVPPEGAIVPLLVNGQDYIDADPERHSSLHHEHNLTTPSKTIFQGADVKITREAIDGAQQAFANGWSQASVPMRRALFHKMVEGIKQNESALKALIKAEIHCDDLWADIQYHGGISVLEESAASLSSEATNGQILPTVVEGAYPLVVNEPYGVVLAMAPWNAPLILGLRCIAAPLAACNTVVFRGSEMSPRVHSFIANLVRYAGFPPGVCNFLLHRPQDAAEVFETCISHPAVKKANFTGSTAVGRAIATAAARFLKPVLLELGGKNVSIVLEDADLDKAAAASLQHAIINNGQVCMCTDTILVARPVLHAFSAALHRQLGALSPADCRVISSTSRANLARMLAEAAADGATITQAPGGRCEGNLVPVAVLENLTAGAAYHTQEAFGPVVAVHAFGLEQEAVDYVRATGYGLSSAVWTGDTMRAMRLARQLDVGAVHVNGGTVHDEGNFPHGGVGNSGYGRFGGTWGLREFTRSKTIMLYP